MRQPVPATLESLLELVVCPTCASALELRGDGLACVSEGRHTFELIGSVPVLLATHEPARQSRLMDLVQGVMRNPRLYEFHQKLGGGETIGAHVAAAISDIGEAVLLDIGAGTGMVARVAPSTARYVWLDNDELKLRGLLARSITCEAVLGDATRLPFVDRVADVTVMVEVSHHIPDDVLGMCLDEVARVTRDRFVFVDGLRGSRLRSNLLWKLDLGRYPRTEDAVLEALDARFEIEGVDRFRINHDHILCVCRPRVRSAAVDPTA